MINEIRFSIASCLSHLVEWKMGRNCWLIARSSVCLIVQDQMNETTRF